MKQYLFYVFVSTGIPTGEPIFDGPIFAIVGEKFWNKNHYLNDQEQGTLGGILDPSWDEITESQYIHYDDSTDMPHDVSFSKSELRRLGLKEIPKSEWLKHVGSDKP